MKSRQERRVREEEAIRLARKELENDASFQHGSRVMLRMTAKRRLGKGEHITPQMADALFYDEENQRQLPFTRVQQAMLIVFGADELIKGSKP